MLLRVLSKITLSVENFVANVAHMWLFLSVFTHVGEKLIERSERLIAHAAI